MGRHNAKKFCYMLYMCVMLLFISGLSTITLSKETKSELNEYDMVIITPNQFVSALQPLVEHKNNYNIHTEIKTLEEIY